MIVIRL